LRHESNFKCQWMWIWIIIWWGCAVEVDTASAAALPVITNGQRSIAEVLPLRLRCRVRWPLPMILDDAVMEQYNQILLFLLQVMPHLF
jgi:hypothetical protein